MLEKQRQLFNDVPMQMARHQAAFWSPTVGPRTYRQFLLDDAATVRKRLPEPHSKMRTSTSDALQTELVTEGNGPRLVYLVRAARHAVLTYDSLEAADRQKMKRGRCLQSGRSSPWQGVGFQQARPRLDPQEVPLVSEAGQPPHQPEESWRAGGTSGRGCRDGDSRRALRQQSTSFH